MSHFAHINENNIVDNVIVAEQQFIDTGVVGNPNDWIQTSYNTKNGVYYIPDTNTPHEGQYDKNNNLINIFESIKDAYEAGFKSTHISCCCKGKRKTALGFQWRYI